MTTRDWIVVLGITAFPWAVILTAVELDQWKRRRRARRRGGLVEIGRAEPRDRVGFARHPAGRRP